MKSYCLKCRKIIKTKIQKFQKQVTVKQRYSQNVQYVVVKNLDLLNIKKQKDY